MKYRNRVRSRISNLKDPKNPSLRRNVLCGAILPSLIARMTAEVGSRVGGTGLALVDHVHAASGGGCVCVRHPPALPLLLEAVLVPKGWLGVGLVVSILGLSRNLPVPPWCWLGYGQRQAEGESRGHCLVPPRALQPPSPSQSRVWDVTLAGVRLEGLHFSSSTGVTKSGSWEPSPLRGEPGPCRQQFRFEDGVIFFIWTGLSPPVSTESRINPGPGEDGKGDGPRWLAPCAGLAVSPRAEPRQC